MRSMSKEKKNYSWMFREFEEYQRGTLWYVLAGVVVGLFLLWGWWEKNFLFLFLLGITVIILFLKHLYSPEEVTCTLDEKGIKIGSKNYLFGEIDFFWVVEHIGDHHILYIHEKRGWRNTLPIPIHHDNPTEIREFLRQYLREDTDRNHEPLWDTIARKLKI